MTRLDDLRAAREGLLARMEGCGSDQTYAVLVRTLTDVLAQIDELSPKKPKEATGLDEFTRRLRERKSGAEGSGRAGSAG